MKPWAMLVLLLVVTVVSTGCGLLESNQEWTQADQDAIEEAAAEMTADPVIKDASAQVLGRRINLDLTVAPGVTRGQAEAKLEESARFLAALQPEMEGPEGDYMGELWDNYYLEAVAYTPDQTPLAVGYKGINGESHRLAFYADID